MRKRMSSGVASIIVLILCGAAEAAVTVAPSTVTVAPGVTSVPVTVNLTFDARLGVASKGNGTLAIDTLPSGVTTSPETLRFTFVPGVSSATFTFRFVVGTDVVARAYPLRIRESSQLQAGAASISLVVQQVVTPTPSAAQISLRGVVPSSVSAGSSNVVLRLIGAELPQGAEVFTDANDLTIVSSRYVSSGLIEALVTVRADAVPGPRSLYLRSAGQGQLYDTSVRLIVLPLQSIAAPAQVLTVATLSPRSGAFVAPNARIFPRGVLATSGAGTVIGSWRINGVPFDRFAIQVRSGRPTHVRARVPIPPLIVGDHLLELVIESPQQLAATPIRLVGASETASQLRTLAPRKNARLSLVPPYPVFRWSLVPGATGYEVEIDREGRAPLRLRLAEVTWTIDSETLGNLGVGVHPWRVRAVFPGDVLGEPSPDGSFAMAPSSVAFTKVSAGRETLTGRSRISWSVDTSGAIYKVEVLREQGTSAAFTALTVNSFYVMPARVAFAAGRSRVRVTALGARGEVLGVSDIVKSSEMHDADVVPRIELAQGEGSCEVTAVAPPENGTIPESAVRVEAQWGCIAAREEVFLEVDKTDVSELATWTESAVSYEPLIPLAVGAHEAKLGLKGGERAWSFTLEAAAATAPENAPAETGMETRGEWQLSIQTALSMTKEPEGEVLPGSDVATLQASGQGQLSDAMVMLRGTGDIAGRRTLDEPKEFVQDNRSWLIEGGLTQDVFSVKVRAGHSGPEFSDQTELLTAGLVRSGLQAKVGLSWLSGAMYTSTTTTADGATSGLGLEQEVRAFALELSKNPAGSSLRAIRLNVDDPGGPTAPARSGSVSGVFGRLVLGTAVDLTLEGARSSIEADPLIGGEDVTGEAARLALTVVSDKGTTITAGVRHRGREFVNPASDGLTATGVPGDSIEASVTHPFDQGRGSIAATGQFLMSPAAPEEDAPNINQTGGSLALSFGMGRPVSLMVSGATTMRTSDAYDPLSLPEIDQSDMNATATLTETWKTLSVSQTGSYQKTSDKINPLSDMKTLTGNLTLNGSLGTSFSAAAILGLTRTEGDPALGATDIVQITLQPSFSLTQAWLQLQPTVLYTKTSNEVQVLESVAEQYGALLSWTPPWLNSLVSLQLTADWSRTYEGAPLEKPSFVKRYGGALTLQWGRTGSYTSAPPPAPVALRSGAAVRAALQPVGPLGARAIGSRYESNVTRAFYGMRPELTGHPPAPYAWTAARN